MTATAYRFHSIEADGPWTSPPFPPAERRHIVQGVIGGFIMGRPRWAEDLSGNFIYGLDAKGKEMSTPPAAPAPKLVPRRRGKNKPKTAAQLDAEIAAAIGPCDSFSPCRGNYACCIHAASTPGTMEHKITQRVTKGGR